jgi:outer membrane protein assembly factor BamE
MRIVLTLLLASLLGACGFVGFPGVYKINVEQGNIVTQEMADQLKPGMSRRQVRFILGTPLVEDSFNQDRWDYPYTKRKGLEVLEESRLTVFFEGDSLKEVRGDHLPPAWSASELAAPDVPGAAEAAETLEAAEAEAEAEAAEN